MGKSLAETASSKRRISSLNQRRQLCLMILAIVVVLAAALLVLFPNKIHEMESSPIVIDLKEVKKEAKRNVLAAVKGQASVGLGSGLGENVGWSKEILRSGSGKPSLLFLTCSKLTACTLQCAYKRRWPNISEKR